MPMMPIMLTGCDSGSDDEDEKDDDYNDNDKCCNYFYTLSRIIVHVTFKLRQMKLSALVRGTVDPIPGRGFDSHRCDV